ncbi:MAG: hypothetical protein M1814_005421 [Vezdaea aestivalis]|nr:MAG: hypothetical protein M1814_005421 [Vezdaea aestivalis]
MSEPIPESIPTSQDPRSRRPTKRRALTPVSLQANSVEALFAHPEREVHIPEAATKDGKPKTLGPPPEIVANVQGSSAGAGSGEFHVYKASRRREYERIRLMEVEVTKEKEATEFRHSKEDWQKKDEAKTNKNKARREKQKARKLKKGAPSGNVNEVAPRPGMRPKAQDTNGNENVVGGEPGGAMVLDPEPTTEELGVIIDDDD